MGAGTTTSGVSPQATAVDAKLNGIFNMLTSQSQHMLALQEQGQWALQEIGNLSSRVGHQESKLEAVEKKQPAGVEHVVEVLPVAHVCLLLFVEV